MKRKLRYRKFSISDLTLINYLCVVKVRVEFRMGNIIEQIYQTKKHNYFKLIVDGGVLSRVMATILLLL